jgi:hypothetical protein
MASQPSIANAVKCHFEKTLFTFTFYFFLQVGGLHARPHFKLLRKTTLHFDLHFIKNPKILFQYFFFIKLQNMYLDA